MACEFEGRRTAILMLRCIAKVSGFETLAVAAVFLRLVWGAMVCLLLESQSRQLKRCSGVQILDDSGTMQAAHTC